MSVEIMGRVFNLAMVSNRKFTLLALANYAGDDGRSVYPSIQTLSVKTGISERTLGRILSEFRKDGVISRYDSIKGKRGLIPVYEIKIERAEAVYGFAVDNHATVACSQEAADIPPVDGGGAKDARGADGQDGLQATVASSQKRLPATGDRLHATGDRLHATGDMTPCHSLAENPLGTVSNNRKDSPPLPPSLKTDDLAEAVQDFNELADRIGLAKVQHFTNARRGKLRKRLAECGGMEGWRAALAKVEASTFLTGGGPQGWRADFDFMLQAKSFTKILEGAYDNQARRGGRSSEIQEAFDRMDAAHKGGAP